MAYFEDEDLDYSDELFCRKCNKEIGYDEDNKLFKCQFCGNVETEDDMWDDGGCLDWCDENMRCPICHEELGYSHRQERWICLDCGISYDEGDLAELSQNPPEHMPRGCVACGNSAYPNCKTNCDAFDD